MRKRYLIASLLSLLAFVLLLTAPGAAQQILVTATPTATATNTPVFTPVVTATREGCEAPYQLFPGDVVYVRAGVTVRNNPSVNGAMIDYTEVTRNFTIVSGPICADGYLWWSVLGAPAPGWIAQGYWMTLAADLSGRIQAQCSPPLNLQAGVRAELLAGLRDR